MLFGREMPGKDAWARRVRDYASQRSPLAIAAGLLGIVAPIDGIFIVPAVASIFLGVLGLWHLKKHPGLLGRRLCILGIVGGMIGLAFAAFLHTWDGPVSPAPAAETAPAGEG